MHYTVRAEDRVGNKIVVGEGLKGVSEAKAVMRLVSKELGLTWRTDDGQNRATSNEENLLAPET